MKESKGFWMKFKTWKSVLCILVLAFGILSSAIGYGFLGGSTLPIFIKFLFGFILMINPALIVQLIIVIYCKGRHIHRNRADDL